MIDELISIVYELYPDYDTIPIEEKELIFKIWFDCNRERYRRMGLDPDNWDGRKKKLAT